MPDTQEVTSKRGKILDRLKNKYPEQNFDDEEALFGQISDDYDDYDERIKEYGDREGSLTQMFNSDPRSARFMLAWRNGEDPVVALLREYGPDILEAAEDEDRLEEIASANKEFAQKLSKEKEFEQQHGENIKTTLDTLAQLQQEQGLDDTTIDNAVQWVMRIAGEAMLGKISRETLQMALNAQNYDQDVNNAREEGMVAGRNQQIDERLSRASRSDGLPSLNGKNSIATNGGRSRTIFDDAADA